LLAIKFDLVVIEFNRLVDLAQRHIEFAQYNILKVFGVAVHQVYQFELVGRNIEMFVDDELVRHLEDEILHMLFLYRVLVMLVVVADEVGNRYLQFSLVHHSLGQQVQVEQMTVLLVETEIQQQAK
jgi:hypothetical protein